MFGLLIPVVASCAYSHEECEIQARAIRAALALAGHNQKTAAAAMGLSQAQVCRLVASGTLTPSFRRLGPVFWRHLLAVTCGLEPMPSQEVA